MSATLTIPSRGRSIIIVLASLVLRLQQGRFWLFHRVDKTIVIPNISTIYGICALAYAARAFSGLLSPSQP